MHAIDTHCIISFIVCVRELYKVIMNVSLLYGVKSLCCFLFYSRVLLWCYILLVLFYIIVVELDILIRIYIMPSFLGFLTFIRTK